jgi:glutamate synthase domain-containing protein 2/rubredoxin
MAERQCGLCTYIYDEDREPSSWDELADDWACPVCGSEKEGFKVIGKTPDMAPEPTPTVIEKNGTNSYVCNLCAYLYDEANEELAWDDLPPNWTCPLCGSSKSEFSLNKVAPTATVTTSEPSHIIDNEYLAEWRRPADDYETHMADIHRIVTSGQPIIEPMHTHIATISWDDILIKGAQLSKLPLNKSQPVSTTTIIGPNAEVPLIIDNPVFVSHMSFGALSREAKLALAKGSAQAKTATCSGEGGILPEELEAAHKYIFEYVPNKYSVTDENLQAADAIEIKIGQSAKPGMGGHLPGNKVTAEIARIRGKRQGQDIISPSRFPDIHTAADLKETVTCLRKRSKGKPIGIKLAAGQLQEDITIALSAGIDFITIDGRSGGTGAALKSIKDSASIPTIFALYRARQILNDKGADKVSLIITGGLRSASDFAKALALGADAIAVATAAMMAVGCQQYRICDSGKCPVGIATQDPLLRARLDIDKSAQRVTNFFEVTAEELCEFARMTGNDDIHGLTLNDLCTVNSEISNHTKIEHI